MDTKFKAVRRNTHKLAVADFETTEAVFGRIPEAFCAGIMHEAAEGESPLYVSFWDDEARDYIGPDYDYFRQNSAANQLFDYLDTLTEPHIIYFHNGGKFDIQYFAHRLPSQPVVFIGARAVAVRYGIHEIRDSAAIVRAALRSTGGKGTIDYKLHAHATRGANRREILRYLRTDCRVLMKAVLSFLDVCCPVGKSKVPLTVSSAAFKQLQRIEGISMRKAKGAALEIQRRVEATFRPYYIGGHVEAFDGGVFEGDYVLVDINSMYPFVMSEFRHPVGERFLPPIEHFKLTADYWVPEFHDVPYFLEFEGTVEGLPRLITMPDGSKRNDYGRHTGTHKYHSHELRVALEFGLVQISRIICAHIPRQLQTFKRYVSRYYEERLTLKRNLKSDHAALATEFSGRMVLIEFKDRSDTINDEFSGADVIAKLFLNGPYGKFAFDCKNYKEKHFINFQQGLAEAADYIGNIKTEGMVKVTELTDGDVLESFEITSAIKDHDSKKLYGIGESGMYAETYYNVATAASITAAARGYLLRALMTCDTPLYCDTDSIICRGIGESVPVSDALGHWKVEAHCDRVVIAGRKLYALWKDGKAVKVAAKGYSLDTKKGAAMDNTARRIEAALVADIKESDRKAKRKPDDSRMVKADFMAYKLGGKHTPIARRLQASPDVLEKARKRLASEGITHGELYPSEVADDIPGTVWGSA